MIQTFLLHLAATAVAFTVLYLLVAAILRVFRPGAATVHRVAWGGVFVISLFALSVPLRLPVDETVLPANMRPEIKPVMQPVTSSAMTNGGQTVVPYFEPLESQRPLFSRREISPEHAAAAPEEAAVRPVAFHAGLELEKSPDVSSRISPEGSRETPEITTPNTGLASPLCVTLFVAWCGGVTVLLAKRLKLHLKLSRTLKTLRRQPQEIDTQAFTLWERLLAEQGYAKSKIPLLLTDSLGPAMVRHGLRSYLLVPRTVCEELSEPLLEGVFRHELAHHLYRDALVTPVLRLLASLLWFHPLSRKALKHYETAVEWSCDEFAFLAPGRRNADCPGSALLAETFLAIHLSTETLCLNLNTFARFNTLERVDRLLRSETLGKESVMKKLFVLSLLALVFVCGTLRVQLVARETPPPVAETSTPAAVEPSPEETRDQTRRVLRRVPYLSDLPLIGSLFEYDSTASEDDVYAREAFLHKLRSLTAEERQEFGFVARLPETTDTERLKKIEVCRYMRFESPMREEIDAEILRLAKSIEMPDLRADQILDFADSAADDGDWEKHDALAGALGEPYRTRAFRYKQAREEAASGNRAAARDILSELDPVRALKKPLLDNRPEVIVQAHYHFGQLTRLGFVEEVRDFLAKCDRFRVFGQTASFMPNDHERYAEFSYYANNVFFRRIFNPIDFLIKSGEYGKAFEIACLVYPHDGSSALYLLTRVLLEENNIDVVTEIMNRLDETDTIPPSAKDRLKRDCCFELVLRLLKNNQYDNALELAREKSLLNNSSHPYYASHLYTAFLDDLFQNGKMEECQSLLNEATKFFMISDNTDSRLSSWYHIIKFAIKLGNREQAEQLLHAVKVKCERTQKEKDILGDYGKLHALLALAEAESAFGNAAAARQAWQDALGTPPRYTSKIRENVISKTALSQARCGAVEEAFATLAMHGSSLSYPEIYGEIGGVLLKTGTIDDAKRARELAGRYLENSPDVRVFGLLTGLDHRIRKAEQDAGKEHDAESGM